MGQWSSTAATGHRHSTRIQIGAEARSLHALPVPLPGWPAHYVRTRALPLAPKPERTGSLRTTAAAVPGTDTGSNAGIDERMAPHIVNFRVRVRQHPVAAAHGCRAHSRFTPTVSRVFEFGASPLILDRFGKLLEKLAFEGWPDIRTVRTVADVPKRPNVTCLRWTARLRGSFLRDRSGASLLPLRA